MNDFKIVQYKTTSQLCVQRESGKVPTELTGIFTKASVAEEAISTYIRNKPVKVDYTPVSTPEIELDKLTKKDALLEFAEIMSIVVPKELKQPAVIKKHIKDSLNA
jgi:hypothetical protein